MHYNMKSTLRLWKLEWKRTLKAWPGMLLEAVLILAILAGAVVGADRFLYRDMPKIQITIAVVEREENFTTDLLLQYIQSMESISETCQFQVMTEDEAFSLLSQKKAAAVLVLPEQLVEGIISGANAPVEIYFPKNAGLESALLKLFTDAGVSMLQTAQAEIYGMYDTAQEFAVLESLTRLEADINQKNLAFALDRMAIFMTENVSPTSGMTWTEYYLVSAMVFFLLLFGMACYPFLQPYQKVLSEQLEREGIGMGRQCLGKWMCGFGTLLFATMGMTVHLSLERRISLDVQQLILLLLMTVCIAAFVFFLFQLTENGITAILLLFFAAFVMMYCAGGFLPSAFLPETIQKIGKILPVSYMLQAAAGIYLGSRQVEMQVWYGLIGYAFFFGAGAYGIASFRNTRWKSRSVEC